MIDQTLARRWMRLNNVHEFRDAQNALRALTELGQFGDYSTEYGGELAPHAYCLVGPQNGLVLCSEEERSDFSEMLIERCYPKDDDLIERHIYFRGTADLEIYPSGGERPFRLSGR